MSSSNNNNNNNSLKSPINITKINKIKQTIKDDYIYIDITNLIGDYNIIRNKENIDNIDNIFSRNPLLKTILYILTPNNNNKNRIIYFVYKDTDRNKYLFVYNTQNNTQHIKPI
jgi:hypothetical protein